MKTLRTVAELRAALNGPRRAGRSIGLVPTMGALHEGHISLIRRARATCDEVVVTLFVNPTQFDESADLDGYPRDEGRDATLAAEAGADILFAPSPGEVYPRGFATTVTVDEISAPLEGAHRGAAHFAGVATVVTKLLNMAQPDVAFFGQKDAQQVAVIRRVVRDLDIPVRIEVGETIRDADGLALSSRNVAPASATSAPARSRCAVGSTRCGPAPPPASATRPCSPRSAAPRWRSSTSSPNTSSSSHPTRSPPSRLSATSACSSPSPRAWATCA